MLLAALQSPLDLGRALNSDRNNVAPDSGRAVWPKFRSFLFCLGFGPVSVWHAVGLDPERT